jgi:uncharacterized protein (DUF885 family)
MTDRRHFLAGAAAALAVGPALAGGVQRSPDAAFYDLLDMLKDEPADATAARARQVADLAALRTVDRAALSPRARFEYDSILEGLGLEAILRSRFPFGTTGATVSPYVVTPRWGAWTQVGGLLKNGPPQTLAYYAAAIDAETARIAADAANGIVPPPSIVAATALKVAAARDRTSGPLPAALDRQVAALKSLPPVEAGIWRLKNGDAYYAQALKIGTSLAIDPATAHRTGLDMVAALNAEADTVLRRQGLTTGTVTERLAGLIASATGRYSPDAAGRAKAVADMTAQLARARAAIAPHFDDIPKGGIAIALAPPGRIGYRTAPSYDGTTPGTYYVDLADPIQGVVYRPAWTLPTVVHHETLPGHLLQLPLQEKAAPHPLRLRYTPNAFFEGWAIYAERLACEIGLLDGDLARLGFLQSLLVRAARLVVDTGIHFQRWTRDDAIARFKGISVFALNPIEDEVDRIIIEPGATAGPALGYLTLMDLRTRAHTSDKDFHTAVLKRGPLRLSKLDWAIRQDLTLPP